MDESELDEIVRLAGGPGFDPFKKQRKEAEKERKANDFGVSPFRIEQASAKQPARQTQQPLFGDLWRAGELAVLIGEPGVGKSLLATQLAEVIARGAKHSVNGLPASKPRHILYFDFERTCDAFSRLYSCRPFPATPYREEYKFSTRFSLARIDDVGRIPDAFKGSVDGYIRHWVYEEILAGEAKVFVIDSVAHLAVGTTVEKLMRALRAAASERGVSILVVAQAKSKRRPSAVTLADARHGQSLIDRADSVFALARSTTHPDIRYVKDLKARTGQLTADLAAAVRSELLPSSANMSEPGALAAGDIPPAAVLTYRIERLASPVLAGTEKSRGPRSKPPDPVQPFLGLNYLGLSLESKHLPQPHVGSSRGNTPRSSKGSSRLPSAQEALLKGLMDGTYRRYLLGD